jgi:hypothetical protein
MKSSGMSSSIATCMAFAALMRQTFDVNQDEWKKKILTKWEESKNYPRKKKKKVRKELQLDWNLACYNPFEYYETKKVK